MNCQQRTSGNTFRQVSIRLKGDHYLNVIEEQLESD